MVTGDPITYMEAGFFVAVGAFGAIALAAIGWGLYRA